METFVEDFRKTIDSAAARLERMSEEQSSSHSSNGDWSPKQIVGHLIDSAANNHARFVRAQFSDDLRFPAYDGDQWVAAQRYDEQPWSQLVTLWKHYNLHLAHVMATAPEQTRKQPRIKHNLDQIAFNTVSQDQTTTLEYLMRDYVDHLRHHLEQVFAYETSTGQAQKGAPASGN